MEYKTLDRWNPVMERYEPFIVPADRKVAVYATDMNTEVQCAECGKKMKYGDGYIHNTVLGTAYVNNATTSN